MVFAMSAVIILQRLERFATVMTLIARHVFLRVLIAAYCYVMQNVQDLIYQVA